MKQHFFLIQINLLAVKSNLTLSVFIISKVHNKEVVGRIFAVGQNFLLPSGCLSIPGNRSCQPRHSHDG